MKMVEFKALIVGKHNLSMWESHPRVLWQEKTIYHCVHPILKLLRTNEIYPILIAHELSLVLNKLPCMQFYLRWDLPNHCILAWYGKLLSTTQIKFNPMFLS